MTEYKLALTGVHARNEKTIQATQDWERARIDQTSLQETINADSEALIALQKKVGADYISDGQINLAWQDLFRPVSSGFKNLSPGPMVRWFNTNTFFYTPIVDGAISTDGKVLSRTIDRKFVNHGASFKVVIADPLTFAELSEDHHYGDKEKLQFAYSDALREEFKTLAATGVKYVQFSAPSLVYRLKQKPLSRSGLKQLGEAIRNAVRGVSIKTGFYPFFGDASPYLPDMLDAIPTDEIGIDLTQTDDASLSGTSKGIIAGIVDARTTYLEDVSALKARAEDVADRTGTKSVTVAPSSDLRFIPRVSADQKLELLGRLKSHLAKGGKSTPRRGSN